MAQNENYSQVDLRVGTEEQFNAKVGTLPAGALFGVTDSTVSKADLSTDLKNEINGKINKPSNPTSDSAVVINSSGTISTKPLSDITGKSEVSVNTTQPDAGSSEVLWIDPDGTSGGGSSSGGGKLYRHSIVLYYSNYDITAKLICYTSTERVFNFYDLYVHINGSCAVRYTNVNIGKGAVSMTMTADEIDDQRYNINLSGAIDENNGSSAVIVNTDYTTKGSGDILQLTDVVLEV